MSQTIAYLTEKSKLIRKHIIEMIGVGRAGHLGGSCSAAELVACLYFHTLEVTPESFDKVDRDKFIMSKGHAVLAQYAALYELGFYSGEDIRQTKTLHGILQGHPDMKKTPGIEANTGSLGQGLSLACGISLAMRLDNIKRKVYVILGDGELAEGQVWESVMAAANHRLDNIVAIVDKNGQASVGFTKDRFDIPNLCDKFSAFGWDTVEIDGHDIGQILDALEQGKRFNQKPFCIIANTVKSKGVPFAEGKAGFHNSTLTEAQYGEALRYLYPNIKEA